MALNMGNLGFSEEGESSIVDHQPPQQKSPEIISAGGGLLSLLRERNLFEKHDQPQLTFPSLILADHHDEVDTTLTLSTAVSRINPTPPPPIIINNPNSSQLADVDTTLTLQSSIMPGKSIVIHCSPTPLRCFHPITNFLEASSSSSSASVVLSLAGPSNRARAVKRKRVNGVERSRSTTTDVEGDRPRPLLPYVREFPGLMQALDSGSGINGSTAAVFLYRKKLERSDVRPDLNRLFVTGREWLMRFLTAEEAAAVDGSKRGVKVLGLDQRGESYSLVLKKWESVNVTIINVDWNKITAANGALNGDLVEIWGFRQHHGKLGFAFIFGRLRAQI